MKTLLPFAVCTCHCQSSNIQYTSTQSRCPGCTLLVSLGTFLAPEVVRNTSAGVRYRPFMGNTHENGSCLLREVQWKQSGTGLRISCANAQHFGLDRWITLIGDSTGSQRGLDVGRRTCHTFRIVICMPTVAWIVSNMAVGKITIGHIAEEAIVLEGVVGDLVTIADEVAE